MRFLKFERYGKRNGEESEVIRMRLATVYTLNTSVKMMVRVKLKPTFFLAAKAWRGAGRMVYHGIPIGM